MHIPAERRKTTIAIPKYGHPLYIIHELGHVLQETIDPQENIRMEPVTEYAKHGNDEAFAEAFTVYCGFDYWHIPWYKELHPRDRALLDSL
jgi:hypothetical protein